MNDRVAWEDQRAFLAVLDTGSISGAARALGLTRPTVSARLVALETATGAVLFNRTTGGLKPTSLALYLATSIRAMASASSRFVRAASTQDCETSDVVRLSVSELVAAEFISPLLSVVQPRNLKANLELVIANRFVDVIYREMDMAVLTRAPSRGTHVARKVGICRYGLFASKEYVERQGAPRTIPELAAHRFVGPFLEWQDFELGAMLSQQLRSVPPGWGIDDHFGELAMARAGLGIAIARSDVGRFDPMLVRILPNDVLAELPIWLLMHRELNTIPHMKDLFSALTSALKMHCQSKYADG